MIVCGSVSAAQSGIHTAIFTDCDDSGSLQNCQRKRKHVTLYLDYIYALNMRGHSRWRLLSLGTYSHT